MKTVKLLKFALVLAAMFAFTACEDENITVKDTTGGNSVENGGAE